VVRLSLVVTTRNDDHGGDLTRRTNIFIHGLAEQARRYKLDAELIIVEWNPPADRPRLTDELTWPNSLGPLQVRIVTVPPEYHRTLRYHDQIPLFQMIAKNVGIRRARGEYVLATNPDLLYSNQLVRWLAMAEFDPDTYYRATRHDLNGYFIPHSRVDAMLRYCKANVGEVHHPPRRGPHTMACGDFTMLSRNWWHRLRAYPEYQLWSPHIDSLFLFACEAAALPEVVLEWPVYHTMHGMSWAERPRHDLPQLDLKRQVLTKRDEMQEQGAPIIDNAADWGLAGWQLDETTVAPRRWARVCKPLTLFATPRACTGRWETWQMNALQSWLRMSPAPDIILFGDEPGVAEMAGQHGCRHVPDVRCNEHGTPLVSDIFIRAQKMARHKVLCYTNADIILPPNLPEIVGRVAHRFSQFLLVGQRTDVPIDEPLDFAPDWHDALRERAETGGQPYLTAGVDYLIFSRGLYENVPKFAVGRTAWDNWLLGSVLDQDVPVVDATDAVLAVHQEHGRRMRAHHPERLANLALYEQHRPRAAGRVTEANWVMDSANLEKRTMPVSEAEEQPVPARYVGTRNQVVRQVAYQYPKIERLLRKVRTRVPEFKVEVWYEQAAVLYALAHPYDLAGAEILEIGTAIGYSAAVLATAAPQARLVTLDVNTGRARLARGYLRTYNGVTVLCEPSWRYLARYRGPYLDLIFNDGDHKQLERDLPWWNWLKIGGLMLLHDYTPGHAPARPCAPVYDQVNAFAAWLGREPDVLQADEQGVGMAGFYRQPHDPNWNGRY
jgi:predicted O-methyltransferase YrrM